MVIMFTKIYILPIVVFVWFPGTFLVTYVIALHSKDIVVFMPYVSDTGTYSPESCIFGQMLNTGSILMATVMYVRFRQVQEVQNLYGLHSSVQGINTFSLWLGLIATFGVSLVGNFQETNIFSVHMLGAGMAFGLGTIYQVLQTFLSMRVYPKLGCISVNYCRIAISALCFVASTITLIFAGISLLAFDGKLIDAQHAAAKLNIKDNSVCNLYGLKSTAHNSVYYQINLEQTIIDSQEVVQLGKDITKWTSEYGGYKAHVVSAIAEWITVTLTMSYILTFAYEFKNVIIYEPEMEHIHEEIKYQSNSPNSNRY